jgi:hypothetical protein
MAKDSAQIAAAAKLAVARRGPSSEERLAQRRAALANQCRNLWISEGRLNLSHPVLVRNSIEALGARVWPAAASLLVPVMTLGDAATIRNLQLIAPDGSTSFLTDDLEPLSTCSVPIPLDFLGKPVPPPRLGKPDRCFIATSFVDGAVLRAYDLNSMVLVSFTSPAALGAALRSKCESTDLVFLDDPQTDLEAAATACGGRIARLDGFRSWSDCAFILGPDGLADRVNLRLASNARVKHKR